MNLNSVKPQKLERPDGTPPRVLVVDDELNLTELLTMALRYEGWEVRAAASGMAAVRAAREFEPDAVALDMMLPDMDGLEVLRRMREHNDRIPVLFLTARDAVEDRIAGLTAGGDDYIVKPFAIAELVARVRLALKHAGLGTEGDVLAVADLEMDQKAHRVTRAGQPATLSPTEYKLLRYLLANAKRVLTRDQILEAVWDYTFAGNASVLETYISYLRQKVDATDPPLIHTVRGFGYVMRLDDEET